jgi:hypothetical protein
MDANEWDGDTTTITARLADANGNPVPDGTVINFVSSGGQINRSCSTSTANSGGTNASGFSQCSVILMGQNPRPANGRVAVLAYAEGVKNFTDNNGDGNYTAGTDTLTDMGDAYRDDNENGVYDAGEFLISKGGASACPNGNGSSTGGTGTGGISTTGYGGAVPARGNTCDGNLAGTIRKQIVIFFSSYNMQATAITVTPFTGGATPASFSFTVGGRTADGLQYVPMPSGTTVAAVVTSPASGCTASNLSDTTLSNTSYTGTSSTENVLLQYRLSVTLTGTSTVNCQGATLQITTTTSASGATRTFPLTIP